MNTSAQRPIRAAIIGFGRNGQSMHGRTLLKSPDFELCAVADIDRGKQGPAEKEFGAAFYEDYREMLRKERPDVVSVISRSNQHREMTCECLEAGCHVLVTKPLGLNSAEVEAMISTAKKTGKTLFPWLPIRWSSEVRRVRDLVASGRIGNVFLIRRSVSSFHFRSDWQMEKEHGGGYLLNWGPHIVESAYWILGGKVKTVSGFLKRVLTQKDAEDAFLGILTLDNGATAIVEYTMNAAPLPDWTIQGDGGAISIQGSNGAAREMLVYSRDMNALIDTKAAFFTPPLSREASPLSASMEALYGDQAEVYADVARAIRGETIPEFDLNSALHLTRVLDAIRASQETGTTIVVPE